MVCAAVLTRGLWLRSVGAGCTRHLTLTSIMKSKRKTDHLERTASVARREVVAAAKVCGLADESPSVKSLRLHIADEDFSFKAGQWLCLFSGFPAVAQHPYQHIQTPRVSHSTLRTHQCAHRLTASCPTVPSSGLDLSCDSSGILHRAPRTSLGKRGIARRETDKVMDVPEPPAAGSTSRACTTAHLASHGTEESNSARVDFFIPGVSEVGGFSICSSPSLLEQERMIELAVKYTKHPPALWIHNKCTLGSEVAVRVGGEFFFDPQPTDALRSLVLIAGGVGINPLLSILRHSADLHRARADGGHGYAMGPVRLLYSAKDSRELLFKKTILDIVNEFPGKITCSFHVTKQTTQISAELKPYITEGRITEEEIRDHISRDALFYLCGPPPMTDFFSKQLESSHVPREHICYEKWW